MTYTTSETFNQIEYFRNGVRHRDNDLPAMINGSDMKWWYQNGLLHRDNEPAILFGLENFYYYQVWFQHGKRHRINGPAKITKYASEEWFVNGRELTIEVNEWMKENDIKDWKSWSKEDIMLFALTFRGSQ